MKKRGNKAVPKAKIVRERFEEAKNAKGLTYKDLAINSEEPTQEDSRDRSVKTIWRYVKQGVMPYDLLDRLAQRLDVHPDFIMGKYDISEKLEVSEQTRKRMQSFIRPERFPYATKEVDSVKVDQYYTALLAIHDISLAQFIDLEPDRRFQFQHDVEAALVPVLLKYFSHNVRHEDGYPNFYELDSQISNIEEDYARFGLDYWRDTDYFQKRSAMEDEQLSSWE